MEYKAIYEDMNFKKLMKDMLERVPDNLDKREGSIIWDALAPAALEFENLYNELDIILRNSFGSTADREYLILRAQERDVSINEATSSIVKCKFNVQIESGSRFNYEDINFTVFEFIEEKEGLYFYKARCENIGTIGNVPNIILKPIEHINGLSIAEVVEIIIPGEDEEDTESFRERYFESIKRQDYGGNIDDYKRKVKAINGIYGVKVYPIWAGGGTVKLVIQNSELKSPSEEMVREVQEIIDPVKNQGKGVGIAPIGHVVTVLGVEENKVNVTLNVTLEHSKSYHNIETEVKAKIENYLLDLSKNWDKKEYIVVRVSQIESRILDIEGVLDTVVKINGKEENLELGSNEIPVIGVVTNE